MKTYAHVGKISETINIKFDNGYALELEAGQQIALHVVVDETIEPDSLACEQCGTTEMYENGLCWDCLFVQLLKRQTNEAQN